MSQFPAATSGLAVAEYIDITGGAITKVKSALAKVTLSLAGNNRISQMTATVRDSAGNVVAPNSGVTWTCYNSNPTSGSANAAAIGSSPSYGGQIATVSSDGTLIAVSEGEAWIEASVVAGFGGNPAGDNTAVNAQSAGKAYGLLQVSVVK